MLSYVKHSCACHPLMELCHYIIVRTHIPFHEALDDLSGRIAEHHRLDLVPLTLDRVKLILLPKMGKYLILNGIHRGIVNEYSYRFG